MKRFWLLVPALASVSAPIACGDGPLEMQEAVAVADAGAGADARPPSKGDGGLVKAHLPGARIPKGDASAGDAHAADSGKRGDAAPVDGGSTADAIEEDAADAAPGDAALADAAAAPITITGTVTDSMGLSMLTARTVEILDKTGASSSAVTDASGAFSVSGVVPPYSISIPAVGSSVATAYLGLVTPNPTVFGYVDPATEATATVSLSVQLPSCAAGWCLLVVSDSLGGVGYDDGVPEAYPSGSLQSVTLNKSWPGSIPAPAFAVQLLVTDPSFSTYWYVGTTTTLTAGGSPSLGTLTPAPVPTAGTITVASTAYGTASSWSIAESVLVEYPAGGGSAFLTNSRPSPLSVGVPDIPGVTMGAQGYAIPSGDAGIPEYEMSIGTMNGVAPGTSSVALSLYPPATWLSPSTPGTTIPSSSYLGWSPGSLAPPDLSVLFLGQSYGSSATYVFTSGTSVSLTDLATLNVALPPGSCLADVYGYTVGSSLDALVGSGELISNMVPVSATMSEITQTGMMPFTLTP